MEYFLPPRISSLLTGYISIAVPRGSLDNLLSDKNNSYECGQFIPNSDFALQNSIYFNLERCFTYTSEKKGRDGFRLKMKNYLLVFITLYSNLENNYKRVAKYLN